MGSGGRCVSVKSPNSMVYYPYITDRGCVMYQKSYTEFIKEDPNSEFSKFLVRFFSAKPDFTNLNREVEEFETQLHKEQMAELQQKLAEKRL